MAKRADRLRHPHEFKAGLSTKPAGKAGPFMVHITQAQDQFRLGFVLPRRFVKKAVTRNLIKRWARDVFWQDISRTPVSCHVIVRLRQPLDTDDWATGGRQEARRDLQVAMKSAVNIR